MWNSHYCVHHGYQSAYDRFRILDTIWARTLHGDIYVHGRGGRSHWPFLHMGLRRRQRAGDDDGHDGITYLFELGLVHRLADCKYRHIDENENRGRFRHRLERHDLCRRGFRESRVAVCLFGDGCNNVDECTIGRNLSWADDPCCPGFLRYPLADCNKCR